MASIIAIISATVASSFSSVHITIIHVRERRVVFRSNTVHVSSAKLRLGVGVLLVIVAERRVRCRPVRGAVTTTRCYVGQIGVCIVRIDESISKIVYVVESGRSLGLYLEVAPSTFATAAAARTSTTAATPTAQNRTSIIIKTLSFMLVIVLTLFIFVPALRVEMVVKVAVAASPVSIPYLLKILRFLGGGYEVQEILTSTHSR